MTENNSFYKNILDNLYDGVYLVDRDRRITYWNRGAERLTGYQASEVLGKFCSDNILMHVDERGTSLCRGSCPLAATIADGRLREKEIYFHHKEGHRIPILVRAAPLRDSKSQIIGAVEIFSEYSFKNEMMQRIDELERLALVDSLTKVGNRRYGEINLHSRFNEMHRFGWRFGVLFIDIDDFKSINDQYGHDIGDRVLKMVATTILNNIRSFDVVCRWGGEEFLAMITNVKENHLYLLGNRLCALVENSGLTVGSDIVRVTISIGATLADKDETADELLKRADSLMYHSKKNGRNMVSMK